MSQQAERRIDTPPPRVAETRRTAPRLSLGPLLPGFALVAAWGVVILLVGLGGDFPLNDDWAYAHSARHLRATGEVRILDWAAPSLVGHIAWGALIFGLFEESYRALRVGTLAWGAVGLLLLYAVGRRSRFTALQSLFFAAAVGFSPWYVNLSFTFMTDIPWLVLVLGAAVVLLGAGRGQTGRLLAAGALLALASLWRQLAVICAPAFLLLIAVDAFGQGADDRPHRRWHVVSRGAIFLAPLVLGYGAFHLWYTRVHGATLANRLTWQNMLDNDWWNPIAHTLAIWHYLGLWSLPAVAAVLAVRRLRAVTWRRLRASRTLAVGAALALGGFAIVMAVFAKPGGLEKLLQPTMPYLGNLVFLFGAGPLTLYETYTGRAAFPHQGIWFGYLLSALTTVGGVFAAVWIATAVREVRSFFRRVRTGAATLVGPAFAENQERARVRLLIVALAGCYLGWHVVTAGFLFDRYVFVVMPFMVWITLDRVGPELASSRWAHGAVLLFAIFSAGATREYLAWNAAREQAVRGLEARGISPRDIDGGFEVNGPRHYQAHFARTKTLMTDRPHPWWIKDARYRLSFWPAATPGCRTLERHPFWTWPGSGPRAIYVLECGAAAPVVPKS
jgi:Dolichyl-phosphate-mannose-protein mannosyltransferase